MTQEPIVFLPDMMCDARLFGAQIEWFSKTNTIICAPIAIGETLSDIARAMMENLPKRFALVGQGIGANVALEMIRLNNEAVSRVAVMGLSPMATTPADAADREPRIISARTGRLEDMLRIEVPLHHLCPSTARQEILNYIISMGVDIGIDGYVSQTRIKQRMPDQQSLLRRCNLPAMVICGQEDQNIPLKRHQLYADLIPHAKISVVEGAGRFPTLENPYAVTQALTELLDLQLVLR